MPSLLEDPIDYADLADALQRLGAAEAPSEYHGLLCGALCVQDPRDVDALALLDEDSREFRSDLASEGLLQRLAEQSLDALVSTDMRFAPLLPDDGLPLGARTQALALWCQGFLYGLASRHKLDFDALSEEAREILRDLTQFTQAGLEAGDDDELEESAYAELVEYIRVGAQLLFIELNPNTRRSPEPDGQPTLH